MQVPTCSGTVNHLKHELPSTRGRLNEHSCPLERWFVSYLVIGLPFYNYKTIRQILDSNPRKAGNLISKSMFDNLYNYGMHLQTITESHAPSLSDIRMQGNGSISRGSIKQPITE
jgi:hypothetical protein